ncbi:MAG: peptide chain release factor N(5)-glutamine methyltransferase [Pseudomonadota bacterium]
MTRLVGDAVREIAARIASRPYAHGQREARALVAHVTGLDAAAQAAEASRALQPEEWETLDALCQRREVGEPLARLRGTAPFWDFDVGLNDATLIPRDDTGVLVESALERIPCDGEVSVADLGTGTGIILLALARERAQLRGLGVDVAPDAVEKARANAAALDLSDRLTFRVGNWLEGVDQRFDLIVSNPPYIRTSDLERLELEVREHDPRLALDAGSDGLDAYRQLLPQAAKRIRQGGCVLVEIGFDQATDVTDIACRSGLNQERIVPDMAGRDRVVVFRPH